MILEMQRKNYLDTVHLQQTKSCKQNTKLQNLINFNLLKSPRGKIYEAVKFRSQYSHKSFEMKKEI